MQSSDLLSCYDGELNALADLAGDFDAASPSDTRRWIAAQWRSVATALGWARPLERAFLALQAYAEGGVPAPHLTEKAALDAFEDWHLERPAVSRGLSLAQRRELARVQTAVIDKLDTNGRGTLNRWRPYIASASLPDKACVDLGAVNEATPKGPGDIRAARVGARANPLMAVLAPSPQTKTNFRAFRSDTAPSYFQDKTTPENVTECDYPVVLSLGTFPFVYGGVLGSHAPGLMWTTGTHSPARRGMRVAASFWQSEANMSQDARVVVAQYRHFRTTTDRVLADVVTPSAEDHRPIVGEVYRQGGLLHVYQGALELVRFQGPRGVLAASSYNYVKLRFAAFFAARRAYVRARDSLTPAARSAIARNPDPCLRETPRLAVERA